MRICYIAPYPPQKGGIEYQVQNVVSRLKREHEVHVMTYGRRSRSEAGVNFHEVPVSDTYFFRGVQFVMEVVKRLREMGDYFDLVHAHPIHPGGTAVSMAKFGTDYPIVMTAHGSDLLYYSKKYPSEFFKKVSDSANNLVCVSRFLVKRARKIGISTKLNHIPNGIDFDEIENIETWQGYEGKDVVLFVGSLAEHKRPFEMLRLARAYPGLRFDIVGDGPLRDDLELTIVNEGLENVNLVGARTHKESLRRIKGASCLMVPSRYEGFGLVALEAMALETPVIVNNVPALDELVSDKSFSSDFGDTLDKIMNSGKYRRKMVSENYRRSKRYNIDKKAKMLKNMYESLL